MLVNWKSYTPKSGKQNERDLKLTELPTCGSSKQRGPKSKNIRVMTKQDLPVRSKNCLKGDQEEKKIG